MYIYAKRNKTGSCMHHDALSKDNSLCFLQVDTVILFKLLNLLENQGSTNMWHQCLIFPQKHKKLPVLLTMRILYITKDKKSFIITHWIPCSISFFFLSENGKGTVYLTAHNCRNVGVVVLYNQLCLYKLREPFVRQSLGLLIHFFCSKSCLVPKT